MKMKSIAPVLVVCLLAGCATPAQRATRKRLSEIIIPEIEFRQANIHDVAQFLSAAADPEPPKPENKGIGVIIALTPPEETPPPDPDIFSAPAGPPVPTITLCAKNISFLDAVEAICHATGLRYEIDRNGHLHFKKGAPIGWPVTDR